MTDFNTKEIQSFLTVCVPMRNNAMNTYKIQQHDDYEIDTDSSTRCSKLPVLFDEIPLERCKLFHDNQTVHHNCKHCCDDQGDLQRAKTKRTLYFCVISKWKANYIYIKRYILKWNILKWHWKQFSSAFLGLQNELVYQHILLKTESCIILTVLMTVFTMKKIPETDTRSRVTLSDEGWWGSGFPVMGFIISIL